MNQEPRRQTRPRRPAGVTLLEALIALAVLAIALFLAMGLIVRQPAAAKRLESSDEALRSIEAAIETIRAVEDEGGRSRNSARPPFFGSDVTASG